VGAIGSSKARVMRIDRCALVSIVRMYRSRALWAIARGALWVTKKKAFFFGGGRYGVTTSSVCDDDDEDEDEDEDEIRAI